jgi:hypothetical protein
MTGIVPRPGAGTVVWAHGSMPWGGGMTLRAAGPKANLINRAAEKKN